MDLRGFTTIYDRYNVARMRLMEGRDVTEEELDKERIECVFCVELIEESWKGFAYWYEGLPDYIRDPHDGYVYRTVIIQELWGKVATPEGWERHDAYTSSGEGECRWCGDGTEYHSEHDGHDPGCELCEGDGLVYLGNGWREVVIRMPEDAYWERWEEENAA